MEKDRLPDELLRVGRDELAIRVPSAATGGALMAAEVCLPPGGGPPFLHRHDPEEIYRVHSGVLAFYVEDEAGGLTRREAAPGTVVHLPGGCAHTVRNESTASAVAFVVFAPGGPMEAFARAAATLGPEGDIVALAERHGITRSGPVPTPAEC